MNPWGLLIIALGILLMIVGIKGSQHNIASAITNKPTAGGAGNTNSGTTGNPNQPPGTGTVFA